MVVGETFAVDVENALTKHADMVYKIALSQTRSKFDADDVFQEVFMRLVKSKNKIKSEEHLKAWLIRVTLNCSKNHFRMWSGDVSLVGDVPDMTQQEHDILLYVMELPEKYRTVIHLFYYEELSIKEMSGALKIKESTIKSQLSRGREMLRERMGGGHNQYDGAL